MAGAIFALLVLAEANTIKVARITLYGGVLDSVSAISDRRPPCWDVFVTSSSLLLLLLYLEAVVLRDSRF